MYTYVQLSEGLASRTYVYSYSGHGVYVLGCEVYSYLQLGEGLASDHDGMLEVFDDEDQLPATS